ncbi:hypothetical protein AZE42_10891 [Rhizopogon vesiculosus]|uniref:ABC transmembrane type-1 domain-containing protein n=1 Tax=Rhizopogon vesiculosus TaxID=180088 RepID=A0A1J8R213_9AGAM|nr:hypothetical protein AZE42_10891 [Rhizopogon vesiculosus]
MPWVTSLCHRAFSRVVRPSREWRIGLTRVIVNDGDDARRLIAVVVGQIVAIDTTMTLGLLLAMTWGSWVFKRTLWRSAKYEVRDERVHREVARVCYESILDVPSHCLSTGVRGTFVEGCSYGVAGALVYLPEVLLFYVGAVLIAEGTYTYLHMRPVLNLVFTVSIDSQLMAFTQIIAEFVQVTSYLNQLVDLGTMGSSESQRILRQRIDFDVVFNNVSFYYPTNPDVSVLNKLSMCIA